MATTSSPRDLPDFSAPPVVEVVVGISFAPIAQLDALAAGKLHALFEADYPKTRILPPLPTPAPADGGPIQISFAGFSPMVRVWMLSDDEDQLIQVQNDRLVLNWRRRLASHEYPRYETLRAEYARLWDAFFRFATERKFGPILPTHAEVTFVNRITAPEGERPDDSFSVVNPFVLAGSQRDLVRFQMINQIEDDYAGTVTISAEPDIESSILTISTLISLEGREDFDLLEPLDRAHDIGVKAFTSSTRGSAHERWGRTQ